MQSLIEKVWRLAYVDNHRHLAQTGFEKGLEKPGQFTVSIRHNSFIFGILHGLVMSQVFNNAAQYHQGSINVAGLLLSLTGIEGLLDTFTASQVTKRQKIDLAKVGIDTFFDH